MVGNEINGSRKKNENVRFVTIQPFFIGSYIIINFFLMVKEKTCFIDENACFIIL